MPPPCMETKRVHLSVTVALQLADQQADTGTNGPRGTSTHLNRYATKNGLL